MATIPKFCRIAITVDDMEKFEAETTHLLGLKYIVPGLAAAYPDFVLRFGEHGLEPIQTLKPLAFAPDGQLIEVAIDVASAEETKALFNKAGYEPIAVSYLPAPDKNEYLFGRDFHGLPMMVCTAGDNEMQMRAIGPFNFLADAPPPKIGCVSVIVNDIAAVKADFEKFLGMKFVETDPAGLGKKAVVGDHRVKLVEGPSELLSGMEMPLAAIEYVLDDVEAAKTRFEKAGYPVRYTRKLKSGGNAYYFGATTQGMPVYIYPVAGDAEIIGQ
jgi:catechol 2,3-dioxygenase-like lactoylglutathione lyase family enzyme